ncbi:MAG: transcriptional regulator [Micavibrio sp.]|nr:transcriptional regulator [Micavibrio sp.]
MKSIYKKNYQKLTALLVAARKQTGITQQALAEALNKPQSYIAKIENNERRLDIIEFMMICEALNIQYQNILEQLKE